MGDFDVIQRTKDGFFNATKLINDWDNKNDMTKNVNHYLSLSSTKEFIDTIVKRESDIPNHERPVYQPFIKTRCVTFSTATRKKHVTSSVMKADRMNCTSLRLR